MKKVLSVCLAGISLAVAFSGCGGKKLGEYESLRTAVATGDISPMLDYVKDGMVRVKGNDENGKFRDFYIGTVNVLLSTMFAGMDVQEFFDADSTYLSSAEYEIAKNLPFNFCAMTYDGMVDVVNSMSVMDGKVPYYQGEDYERHPLADGYRIADLQELRLAQKNGEVNYNLREMFESKLESLRKSGPKEIKELLSGNVMGKGLSSFLPGFDGTDFSNFDDLVTFFDQDIDYTRNGPEENFKDELDKVKFTFQSLDRNGNVVDMEGYVRFLSSLMNFYVVIDARNFK